MTINATTKRPSTTCPEHNDPLKVYCETCTQIICCECTISTDHKTHDYHLIDECFPEHRQQIDDNFKTVKHRIADINTAVTQLDTTEREVIEQGEQLQEQINTHAQQIIDQVQRSRQHLSQQLHNIVQCKKEILAAQKQQAQRLHTQLNTCQEMIEHRLQEWTPQQILTEKHAMINQMNTTTQHVDPTVFQPIDNANVEFIKTDLTEKGIGFITGTTYDKSILLSKPCLAKRRSTAMLTIDSLDGSPFTLPRPSLISSTLSSPGNTHSVKCNITQKEAGKYNITFTPTASGKHQLSVQVGGADISGSPFTLPVIPQRVNAGNKLIIPPTKKGTPVQTITELNKPWGIAVRDNGDIVVAENDMHRITTLNKEGKEVREMNAIRTKDEFINPSGVAIAIDGHVLITDNHRLQKLSIGVSKTVGSSKSGSGHLQFDTPRGITVHPSKGYVFVADCYNNRIQVFNNDLTFKCSIALSGSKGFNHPCDVAIDNEGYLYVADVGNQCVTKLTTKGQYILRIGSERSAQAGQLCGPTSLAISNNLVYVSEQGNNCVSIFHTDGTFFRCFGKRGNGEGEFDGPCSITIDSSGNLYVSDTNNGRIVVF